MQLPKQPETEREYWEAIEALGGYIFSTTHAISRGHIPDSAEVSSSVTDAQDLSGQLVDELGEKFNVLSPPQSGCDPGTNTEGKEPYRDWYQRWKRTVLADEYNQLICSGCALSEGLDRFIQFGGAQIPCGPFCGAMYRLRVPFLCGMVSGQDWTEDQLHTEIRKVGGSEAVEAFQAKEAELKAAFQAAHPPK